MAVEKEKQIARLIEQIQSYPCIWDTRHVDYIQRDHAREAYLNVARETGMNEEEVKRKFRSLRTHYTFLLNKMVKSGASTDDVAVPAWKYFHLLDFLRPCVTQRKGKDNTDDSQLQSQNGSYLINCPEEESPSELMSENLDQSVHIETEESGDIFHLYNQVQSRQQRRIDGNTSKTNHLQDQVGPMQHGAKRLMNHTCTASPQSVPSDIPAQIGACVNINKTVPGGPVGMPSVQSNWQIAHKCSHMASQQDEPTAAQHQNSLDNDKGFRNKRKSRAMEEAVRCLKKLVQIKNDKDENYFCFKMLEKQFARLPDKVQETLRYEFISRTHEELQKISK